MNYLEFLTPEAIDEVVIREMSQWLEERDEVPQSVIEAARIIKRWYSPVQEGDEWE